MQDNKTFAGYRYQQKCALALLLRHYGKPSLTHIALEHAEGDDFDLHFKDKVEVYQAKRYGSVTTMKDHLKTLWRKYHENIVPAIGKKNHSLNFIFSQLSANGAFVALHHRNHESKKLESIFKQLSEDSTIPDAVTTAGWKVFLGRLSLAVLQEEDAEDNILGDIQKIGSCYEVNEAALRGLVQQLMDRLSEAMGKNEKLKKQEIKSLIDQWHRQQLPHHIAVRDRVQKAIDDTVQDSFVAQATGTGQIQ